MYTHPASRPRRRSFQVPCELVRERDFRRVGRHIVDLSLEGCLVAADRPVLTGEPLILTFRVPMGSLHWFDAECVVTRVVHARRPEDRSRALGIAFTWTDPVGREALERELGWFPFAKLRPRAA